ncbi:MAG: hypothetical protein AAGE65_02170 [Planctomycetota bacterium]
MRTAPKIKSVILAGVLIAVVAATGCVVVSLHPLYSPQRGTFDPALVGMWAEHKDGGGPEGFWQFETIDDGEHAYRLTLQEEEGDPGEFVARLVEIDGHRFLDLFPERPELDASVYYQLHLLPAHGILHVEQIEPTLRLRGIDQDWLAEALEADPSRIAHTVVEDDVVVLTAPTEALQVFVVELLDEPDAYSDALELRRIEAPAEPDRPTD